MQVRVARALGQREFRLFRIRIGRLGDFALANAMVGYAQTPPGHVWHHFHDWAPPLVNGGNGYGTLYLMTTAEHAIYHCGGVLQMETHMGIPYRP